MNEATQKTARQMRSGAFAMRGAADAVRAGVSDIAACLKAATHSIDRVGVSLRSAFSAAGVASTLRTALADKGAEIKTALALAGSFAPDESTKE
ncbi:MAG: hypothetical protein ABI859_08190 [Pseudomonadota bacterium]